MPDNPLSRMALANAVHEMALKLMANFSFVGQEVGSNDCGFFCGYVLGLVKRRSGNMGSMTMSRADVYAARDKWLQEKIGGAGKRWLHPAEAGRYLASVGVTGYAEDKVGALGDASRALTHVRSALQSSANGIMIPYFGSGAGHWVAVLKEAVRTLPRGNQNVFYIYDPAPGLTVHGYWVAEAELGRVIVHNNTHSIVSA